MADNIIKTEDLNPVGENLKGTAQIPISQDKVDYRVSVGEIEQSVLTKVSDRYLEKDSKIPNENLTFGEVKEGDFNVVSGGEVAKQFDTKTLSKIKKGKYIDNINILVTNDALEYSDYVYLKQTNGVYISCRGSDTIPSIIFYDDNMLLLGKLMGNSSQQLITLDDINTPDGTKYVRYNSLLNKGYLITGSFNKEHESTFFKLKTEVGFYTNKSGIKTPEKSYQTSELLLINDDIVFVNLYSNGGSELSPIVYFDVNKSLIQKTNSFAKGVHNISVKSDRPVNAIYCKVNSFIGYDVLMNGDTNNDVQSLLTKDFDTSVFVKKEIGKGLSENNFSFEDKSKVDKIKIEGTGNSFLNDKGEYVEFTASGNVIERVVQNEGNINPDNINNSRKLNKTAKVVLTFDDGYFEDFTEVHTILKSKGVRGTFYINEIDIPTKLTSQQVVEMANYGHEFGSHSQYHTMLAKMALHKGIEVGDTEIQVINQYKTANGPLNLGVGIEYEVVVGSDAKWNVFKVTKGEIKQGYQTLKLTTPSTIKIDKPMEIWFSENSIKSLVLQPKNVLENLGIDCVGFAYPFGSGTAEAVNALKSIFSYGRNAYLGTGGNPKTFGGFINGGWRNFNQFEIPCYELIDMTDVKLNEMLDLAIQEGSIFSILGHSSSGATMWNKLSYFIDLVKSKGIEIVTMKEALGTHGYVADFNGIKVNAVGELWGGVTTLPTGYFSELQNLLDYPQGFTIQTIDDAERIKGSYPCAGMLITIKPFNNNRQYGHSKSNSTWTTQFIIEIDKNTIYTRKRTGNIIASEWDCLTTRNGTTPPLKYNHIGSSFFNTQLNKMQFWNGNEWV